MPIWRAYRKKYGPFFFGRRIEQGFGNLMAAYLASKGAENVSAYSFMPHEKEPEEVEYSVDEMFEKGLGKLA
ncbi:hypothetical protein [Acinetobacter johnsonii]|uniref:hypothetical protein n=1 Tax=Acinetobacter johnsonii TaxID=40214 RepID=UPI003D647787